MTTRQAPFNSRLQRPFHVWSQSLVQDQPDLYTALLDEQTWRKVHDEYDGTARRIFAHMKTAAGDTYCCALGHPVIATGDIGAEGTPIFLPPWLLQALHLEGVGEEIRVEWITEEYAPEATRIVLRPHDSAFFCGDAREELEPVLTRYGILQKGATIPVPLEALGGYVVLCDVIKTEPADLVIMEGDEVAIEFEEALDAAAQALDAATQAPKPKPLPYEPMAQTEPMVPSGPEPAAPVPQGNILGGQARPRLPDGRAWNPWRSC